MRMWMVDPRILCNKHLLGEHVELHMFKGHLEAGRKIEGYIESNCVEPFSIIERHNALVQEMQRRGYVHKSELNAVSLSSYTKQSNVKINKESSLNNLLSRCEGCRNNALNLNLQRS